MKKRATVVNQKLNRFRKAPPVFELHINVVETNTIFKLVTSNFLSQQQVRRNKVKKITFLNFQLSNLKFTYKFIFV